MTPRIPEVTQADIVAAMIAYDSGERPEVGSSSTKYSVLGPEGEGYSPKLIISLATGKSVREFSGGDESHRYLTNLGFTIIETRTGRVVAQPRK